MDQLCNVPTLHGVPLRVLRKQGAPSRMSWTVPFNSANQTCTFSNLPECQLKRSANAPRNTRQRAGRQAGLVVGAGHWVEQPRRAYPSFELSLRRILLPSFADLLTPHRVVEALVRQQLGMAAELNDPSAFEHINPVGVQYGG